MAWEKNWYDMRKKNIIKKEKGKGKNGSPGIHWGSVFYTFSKIRKILMRWF